MKAVITTTFCADIDEMWTALQKTSSLMYVAAPILTFKREDGESLPERWELDREYPMKLYLLGIVPLGKHSIRIKRMDTEKKEILSQEEGFMARTWNHHIMVEKADERNIRYTDAIEVKAGLLTVFVWMFAHLFYRHRQRKWKRLLGAAR